MPIRIDRSHAGIVVVTFSGSYSDADFDAYLATMTEMLNDPGHRAVILDARGVHPPSASQARRQGLWMKQHREALLRYALGTAFVFDSPAQRFVLSSSFLVQKPPSPYLVTPSFEEAVRWCEERLRQPPKLASAP